MSTTISTFGLSRGEKRRVSSRIVGGLLLPTMERPEAVTRALAEWMAH
jgi:hypothetical protein